MESSMNERVRAQYLSVMGVATYVPRWSLPNACPSVQARLPVHYVETEPADTAGRAEPQAKGGAVPVSELMGDWLNPATEPAARQEGAVTDATELRASLRDPVVPDVRFTLNVWHVNALLMVVDSHIPKSALPTARLLANMLLALGHPPTLPGADALVWPMFKGALAAGGWGAARDMVGAFLHSRLEQRSAECMWLMGAQAYDAIAPELGEYSTQLGKAIDLPALSVKALVLPSLAELLKTPELKRLAWRALQADFSQKASVQVTPSSGDPFHDNL